MNQELAHERKIIDDLEQRIKNNQFESKEELFREITNLKNKGLISHLDNEKIKLLLDLYDSIHKEPSLDMKTYSNVELENQNLIVSQENDKVLNTLNGSSEFVDEFKQIQNEIAAKSNDGLTNANEVFEHMANYQKEEMTLIPLMEVIEKPKGNIDKEILIKIRYFVSNTYVNPYIYKVNVDTGIFYNIETNEIYEVRKNEETNTYEVYKGGEKIYGTNSEEKEETVVEKDINEEKMAYESTKDKHKVRKLAKPNMNNAAFTKIGFLLINILTFAALITMMLLLNK